MAHEIHGAHWTATMDKKYKHTHAVYIISQRAGDNDFKIGFSKDLAVRMSSYRTCFRGDVLIHCVAEYPPSQTDTDESNAAEQKLHKYLTHGGVPGVIRVESRRPRPGRKYTEWFNVPSKKHMNLIIKQLTLQSPLPTLVKVFATVNSRGRRVYPVTTRVPRAVQRAIMSDPLRSNSTRRPTRNPVQRQRDQEAIHSTQSSKKHAKRVAKKKTSRQQGKKLRSDTARLVEIDALSR